MCKLINRKDNVFGDEIAYVENLDFSRANLDDTNRILAITSVASICYQSGKSVGSESLYNRLQAESGGLPSSSFEFVPVLLPYDEYVERAWSKKFLQGNLDENNESHEGFTLNMEKYGCWVEDGKYLLTNYRAIVYDFENSNIDLRDRYNTEEECSIIAKYYWTFKFKVDFPTRSQIVRHRSQIQELSRRFVSGKKVKFEHYISGKMKKVKSTYTLSKPFREAPIDTTDDLTGFAGAPLGCLMEQVELSFSTQEVIDICMNHYFKALEDGVKPQEARRIIPQTGYTELYMSFQPYQLANFFKLRDDADHAQWEVRQIALAMKELLNVC